MLDQRANQSADTKRTVQPDAEQGGYSVANAQRFGWGSLSGQLPAGRLAIIKEYVIGPRVLDAGCGGGGYVDYLAGNGFDAVGIDKHDMFLHYAASRKLKGRYVTGDLTQRLPFDDKQFDTTICFDVLEHIDDRRALSEFARVTRRRLILTVPRDETSLTQFGLAPAPYLDKTHLRHYSAESLRALAATLHPVSVALLDESAIDLRAAALAFLTVRSRFPGVSSVYSRLLNFLLRRASAPDLYMNYAAIIDLSPSAL